MCKIFTAPGSFSVKKYDLEQEKQLIQKIANIIAFSSIRLRNIFHLKTFILQKAFQVFMLEYINFKLFC